MYRLNSQINEELLYKLYNKDVIACGTGHAGKVVIPYLKQDIHIRLHGVTNTRIIAEDAGTFLNTGLPLRSINAWSRFMPNATILVTVTRSYDQQEVLKILNAAGFENVILINSETVDAIAYSYLNSYALMREDFMNHCIDWTYMAGNPMLSLMCLANEIRDTNKAAFSEFRACYRDKTVAVVGSGPSLRYYKQLSDVVHMGVNTTFLREDLHLDYYFAGHYFPEIDELKNYDCVKFFAYEQKDGFKDEYPQYVMEENRGRRYFIGYPSELIHTDIEYYPVMSFRSIIFSPIHFALYTRAKKILLVGCDCSGNGYFNEKKMFDSEAVGEPAHWIAGYERVKRFVDHFYPDVEIISVNPVGLKGMFHDVYTESYLNAHPEIDRTACEILNSDVLLKAINE